MFKKLKIVLFIFCAASSMLGIAQEDSLAVAYLAQKNTEELREEQKALNFQKFFFEALQHKAIGNFDKAISALESCQNLRSDDKAVQFEFGKNYLELEKFIEAESYTQKALDKEPENLYILLLLKEIYNRQSNFKAALEVQKKIVTLNADSQLDLVLLYIKNNQIEEAKQLLLDLESQGRLDANLIPFKESLLKGQVVKTDEKLTDSSIENMSIDDLRQHYQKKKSFAVLKELLIKLNNKKQFIDLEKESQEGLGLFPAQPFVYFMNGRALNQMKQYQKGLDILQGGLDYLIDNPKLEADFYEQISLSYKGIGENGLASKFYNKALALRQKKL